MKGILEKLFIPDVARNEFTAERFIHDLRHKRFRDHFNLGICEQKGGTWLLKNFEKEPNALFVGQMGSGKSQAAKFTLFTWLLSNSDQTRIFIVDIIKGAQDYKVFFDLPQVELIDTAEGIHRVLDLVHEEMHERQKIFNAAGANNLSSYEQQTGRKMDRVVVLFEEAHAVMTELGFDKNYKNEGSTAFKYWQLMKVGRAMGLWFIACSQKSTKSDLPPEVIDNYTQKQVFAIGPTESTYLIGNRKANTELSSERPGRCITDNGQVQFPFVEDKHMAKALQAFVKPNDANSAYLKDNIISDYLTGKSSEAIYQHKKFVDLAKQIDNLDAEVVIKMFHRAGGATVESKDPKIDRNAIAQIATFPNQQRTAVMIKTGVKKIQDKYIKQLMKGIIKHQCDNGILYTTAVSIPVSARKLALESGIELVDLEDLIEQAEYLDRSKENKEQAQLDPEHLANPIKEEEAAKYQGGGVASRELDDEEDDDEDDLEEEMDDENNNDFNYDEELVENKNTNQEVDDIKETEQRESTNQNNSVDDEDDDGDLSDSFLHEFIDQLDENEEQKNTQADEDINIDDLKALKRPAVNREMKQLKPEDNPSIMIHCLKNEAGEIYRVLFYTIVRNQKYHRYFIDKKIRGNLDFVQKKKLGVRSVEEWNNNALVLSESDFNTELTNFLNNFIRCENPVYLICWKKDLDFVVNNIIERSSNVSDRPTVLEESFFDIFKIEQSRKDLLEDLSIQVNVADKFFEELEKDFELWKNLVY